jgi:hypothetical protein
MGMELDTRNEVSDNFEDSEWLGIEAREEDSLHGLLSILRMSAMVSRGEELATHSSFSWT